MNTWSLRCSRRNVLVALGGHILVGVACSSRTEGVEAQRATGSSPDVAGRCALCGMRVVRGAAFSSGATDANGRSVLFDSVKCMFRWLERHPDARDPWVTEHLTRTERPAREVYFVVGSNLEGPMGADLVPVETRERAEQVRASHRGERVVAFADVTPALLDELFRM